ncbi:hypothetical protein KKC06_06775, partial [Patescibacteria group bacterium]|nr:hypothetical protein [Patescibacteria group bacterium]
VAGISDSGIGIYGVNTNPLGLWAGYFDGRLESNADIVGAKFLASSLQNSLIPYTSGQTVGSYSFSNTEVKLFDGTHVWLTDNSKVYKVRSTDGFKVFEVDVGTDPTAIIFDGNYMWITVAGSGNEKVIKMDPYSGATECSLNLNSGDDPQGIVFDGTYYWVIASGTGQLIKINGSCQEMDIDINDGAGVNRIYISSFSDSLKDIIFNGSYLWATVSREDAVININPSSGESVRWDGLTMDEPNEIFYDNYFYWVLNAGDNTMTQLSMTTTKTCSESPADSCQSDLDCLGLGACFAWPQVFDTFSTGNNPAEIAFDGTYFWISNNTGLKRILAADTSDVEDFNLGFTPSGLVFDGTYLWVNSPANLVKIYPGTGYGITDFRDILTLQHNNPLIQQSGHVATYGSCKVGDEVTDSLIVSGELEAENNEWGEQEGGDTFTSIVYGDGWFNTGELQAEEGANNIISFLETSIDTLLVGIEGSHIYRSTDAGVNWTDTSGLTDVGKVYTLLQDPFDSAIYAGTGYNGDVFKSIDDGATWTNTANLADSGIDASEIYALLSVSDGRILAGTTGANPHLGKIYETDNGGVNWTVAGVFRNVADDANETPTLVQSLLESPNGDLYAGTNNMGAARVYRSTDGGIKWIRTAGTIFGNDVYSLLEASDNTIYAAISPFGRIYETINQGATWTQTIWISSNDINSLIEDSNGYLYAAFGGVQGYRDHGVYKSTDNGNTWPPTAELTGSIYVNQLFESSDGITIYAATGVYSGLYKTTDEGISWQSVSYLEDVSPIKGADTIQALIEASDGTFYAGSNNGDVYKSEDKGVTWINTSHLPGVSVVNTLLEVNGTVYVGTYPNGDVFKSTDQGLNWSNTANLTGAVEVNSLIQARNGMFIFAGTDEDVFRSANGGVSWQAMGGPEAKSIIEAADGILYAAEGNSVYKSIDIGDSWNLVGSTSAGVNINVLVEDDAGNIYAAVSTSNYVYISADQGATWNQSAGALDCNSSTYQYGLIKGGNGAIYVGTGGGDEAANVWETTDQGANWTRLGNPYLNTAIPGTSYVYSLMESSDGTLHAGTRPNGDVVKLELAAMPVNTYTCPESHFVKNIEVNSDGQVIQIECRGL